MNTKNIKEGIEEVLRNRIVEICDEYRGKKRKDGFQVYLGYPTQLIKELTSLFQQTRINDLERIKIHFETMLFDDTGEDKLINIMEFRKQQLEYLQSLTQELKETE